MKHFLSVKDASNIEALIEQGLRYKKKSISRPITWKK